MKVTFKREILTSCVARSIGCISTEKTYDIIAGILISTVGPDECQISAYDTEKGIKTIIDAEVEEEGSVVINGNKLLSMIRLLSDDIMIETNDQGIATISSGTVRYQVHYKPGDNFPNMPEFSPDRSFTILQKDLKEMISKTVFAVGKDEDKPVMTGLYFEVKDETVKVVGCDSYRLAVRTKTVDTNVQTKGEDTLKFVIPGKTMIEIEKIIEDSDETIKFALTRRHVIFSFNLKYGNDLKETILFSRVIDENYIDYNRFYSLNYKTTVYVQRSLLEDSLTKAALIAEDKIQGQTKGNVRFDIKDDHMYITAQSINGKISDEIAISKTGDDLTIGFSCKYLLEILRATDVDTLKLSLLSPLINMKIENGDEETKDDSFLYLALPVKMRDNRD